MLVTIAFYEVL